MSQAPFASIEDYLECRRIHRRFGTTYFFASRFFPPLARRQVDALYGFVRLADEIVDDASSSLGLEHKSAALKAYRAQLFEGLRGVRPDEPVLRAFCDLVREVKIPVEEPIVFLDAMERDLSINRYQNYEELRQYMRGSASAIGVMMCCILGVAENLDALGAARSLGEAMQLTNFLRDIAEDAARGRIYLPIEDLDVYGVTTEEILSSALSHRFVELMKFQIERARALYRAADAGIPSLPVSGQKAVYIARILYSRILDRIETRGYDVFSGRARTSRLEKIGLAGRVLICGFPKQDQ